MLTSNARIICASNCSLRERVRPGKFREDLYQRLNGLTLLIPPLRERLQELPALIAAELKAAGLKEGQKHHGNSSRSDGEVASPSVARKPSRI
jgi:transcriptional regulator with GAF, ATPase, and Fis domain